MKNSIPLHYVKLAAPLPQVAYWVERDIPRVAEFAEYQHRLKDVSPEAAKPIYERHWQVLFGNVFPALQIMAISTFPNQTLLFWWAPFGGKYENMLPPTEAFGNWVFNRFAVEPLLEDESVRSVFALDREPINMETDIKTTLVRYLHDDKGLSFRKAQDLIGVDGKTFRRHREKGLLLSEQEFKRRTAHTIEEVARQYFFG